MEISDHFVGRVGARIAEKVIPVVVINLSLNEVFMFPQFLFKNLGVPSLWRIFFFQRFLFLVNLFKVILIQFIILLYLLRSGALLKLAEAIIDYFDLK